MPDLVKLNKISVPASKPGAVTIKPTVSLPSKRQALLFQPQEEEEERWYKGDKPTSSEALARIYTISKQDRELGSQLFETFKTYQADPSTPFYSPYSGATNQAVSALSELGYDTSGGVTKDWLQQNAVLKGNYRTGTAGTPLAPSSKSLPEQNAGYWFYQLLEAEPDTERAETEWEALQEDIRYWVGRADRNYSDDEILGRIDWKDYPTLVKMDAARQKGVPLSLNRAVEYSQDALTGVLWAARNGRSTGYLLTDSVQYALGVGTTYRRDDAITAKLDPTSEQYNPYAVGSTIDDAALYFGVSSFSADWLEENRAILASGDKTAIKFYQQVYAAEQDTQKLEAEKKVLEIRIKYWSSVTSDPDRILDGLLESDGYSELEGDIKGDLSALMKLDESLKSGNLLSTTRAVGYRWQDTESAVRQRCEAMNTAPQADAYTQKVAANLGMSASPSESTAAINMARDSAINAAGRDIQIAGTPQEQLVFKTAYSADFNTYLQQISGAISSGTVDAKAGYAYCLERAETYAGKNYLTAKEIVAPYEAALAELEQLDAQSDLDPADYTTATEQGGVIHFQNDVEGLLDAEAAQQARRQRVQELQQIVDSTDQNEYASAKATLANIQEGYTVAEQLRTLGGMEMTDTATLIPVLDYAYFYGKDYQPTQWSAQTTYQAALEAGYSREEVSSTATRQIIDNQARIQQIDYVLEKLQNVDIDPAYKENLEREKAARERDIEDARYFQLMDQPDFLTVAGSYAQKAKNAWQGNELLAAFGPRDGISWFTYSMANPDASPDEANHPRLMTEDERNTYLYLAATQGEDAAGGYYEHLIDPTYGVLNVRGTEQFQAYVTNLADRDPVGSTLLSVLMSPSQALGTVYALGAEATGQEINPYSNWFAAGRLVSGVRGRVQENITQALGEDTPAAWLANLGYQAATSTADSLLNATMMGGTGLTAGIEKAAAAAGKWLSFGLNATASFVGASPMGFSAAGNTIMDAKLRGATDAQAMQLGGASFLAETLTEAIEVDSIRSLFRATDLEKALPKLIWSMVSEFVGEGAGQLTESAVDDAVMQGLSNRSAAIQRYLEEGWSQEVAEQRANQDILRDGFYAGLVGMVSGGMSGGISYAAGAVSRTLEGVGKKGPTVNTPETAQIPSESTDEVLPVQAETEAPGPAVGEPPVPVDESAEDWHLDVDENAEASVGQNVDLLSREVMALTDALDTEDDASRTATLAGALLAGQTHPEAQTMSAAAAEQLVDQYGGEKAVRLVRDIVLTAAKSGMEATEVHGAIALASVAEGTASHGKLAEIAQNGASQENVAALLEAATQNMQSTGTQDVVRAVMVENQIASRVKELVADGLLDGIRSYQMAYSQARSNLRTANADLKQARTQQTVIGQNLQSLQAQYVADTSNMSLFGAVQQATKDTAGAAVVVQQREQAVVKYQIQMQEAAKQLSTVRENALKGIREQARADITAAQEAVTQQETPLTVQTKAGEKRQSGEIENQAGESNPDVRYARIQSTGNSRKQGVTEMPAARNDTTPVVSPEKTIKTLARKLGVGAALGTNKMTAPQTVLGYYEGRAKYLVTRKGRASDIVVGMHEVGHALAAKLGMTGTQAMVNALDPVFPANYPANELPGEAFAEFVWRYMTEDQMAENFAGSDFVTQFEAALKKNGLTKAAHEARDQIQAYAHATIIERARAQIVRKSDKNIEGYSLRERMDQWRLARAAEIADWTTPARQVDRSYKENTGEVGRLQLYTRRRNYSAAIADGFIDKVLSSPSGEILAGPLSDVTQKIEGGRKGADDFSTYLLTKHALDMDALGGGPKRQVFNDRNLSPADRVALVKELEAAHPEFESTAKELHVWWDTFMKAWMVDTGMLPQEVYSTWKKSNPNYVPTFRYMGDQAALGTKRGKSASIKARKGSDRMTFNPVESMIDYTSRIVAAVNKNRSKQILYHMIQQDGMGLYGRVIEADSEKVTVSTADIAQEVANALKDQTGDDVINEVLDIIGTEKTEWRRKGSTANPNTMDVVLPDGGMGFAELYNAPLMRMMMGDDEVTPSVPRFFQKIGMLTELFSRLVTSFSPVFMASNPVKDIQTSINQGHWAATYAGGTAKWIGKIGEVARKGGDVKAYEALGGGGWNRVSTENKRGSDNINERLFKKYWDNTMSDRVKHAGKVVLDAVTLAKIQAGVETLSRYMEFISGKYDLTTEVGRFEGFQGSQDSTVDFPAHGNSRFIAIMRKVFPFSNPAIQGTRRTLDMFSEEQRAELPRRLTKMALNIGIGVALCSALRKAVSGALDWDDEEYALLSDDMKANNYILPNIFPDWLHDMLPEEMQVSGSRRYIRIPISQDPTETAFKALFTFGFDYATGDEDDVIAALRGQAYNILDEATMGVSSILTTGGTVQERLNSLMSGSIFSIPWAVATNLNYFGDHIVSPYAIANLPAPLQYNESTPEWAIALGRMLRISPLYAQYGMENMTGYGGQILTGTAENVEGYLASELSPGEKALGVMASPALSLLQSLTKRFTIDPAYSNDVTDLYAADKDNLSRFVTGVKRMESDGGYLRIGLTDTERKQAYDAAKTLLDGVFKEADDEIDVLWDEYAAVQNNTELGMSARRSALRDIRMRMVRVEQEAHIAMGDFNRRYVTGESLVQGLLNQEQNVVPYTAYDRLDPTFTDDAQEPYMQQATAVWQATGKDSALPHPLASFSSEKVEYVIGEKDWEDWKAKYKVAYAGYLTKYTLGWENLTNEERLEVLGAAHEAGHNAAKKWYMKLRGSK